MDRKSFICATCNKPVDTVDAEKAVTVVGVTVTYRCHGQVERHTIDVRGDLHFSDRLSYYPNIPRRVFLRNWAGYTIRPLLASGRRL